MFMHTNHYPGNPGKKRLPLLVALAFLVFLIQAGIASEANLTITATATSVAVTTTPESSGGSIYFETSLPGATILLDHVEIGTTPFTFYTVKTGTLDVLVRKKGYQDSTGTVTIVAGKRVDFYALLTPLPRELADISTPAVPVPTSTTIRQSTITIPTPWPSPTPSAVDPALVIGAAAIGILLFAIRRR
jgi:hypothetical protein